jgi:hypothetical protein
MFIPGNCFPGVLKTQKNCLLSLFKIGEVILLTTFFTQLMRDASVKMEVGFARFVHTARMVT